MNMWMLAMYEGFYALFQEAVSFMRVVSRRSPERVWTEASKLRPLYIRSLARVRVEMR